MASWPSAVGPQVLDLVRDAGDLVRQQRTRRVQVPDESSTPGTGIEVEGGPAVDAQLDLARAGRRRDALQHQFHGVCGPAPAQQRQQRERRPDGQGRSHQGRSHAGSPFARSASVAAAWRSAGQASSSRGEALHVPAQRVDRRRARPASRTPAARRPARRQAAVEPLADDRAGCRATRPGSPCGCATAASHQGPVMAEVGPPGALDQAGETRRLRRRVRQVPAHRGQPRVGVLPAAGRRREAEQPEQERVARESARRGPGSRPASSGARRPAGGARPAAGAPTTVSGSDQCSSFCHTWSSPRPTGKVRRQRQRVVHRVTEGHEVDALAEDRELRPAQHLAARRRAASPRASTRCSRVAAGEQAEEAEAVGGAVAGEAEGRRGDAHRARPGWRRSAAAGTPQAGRARTAAPRCRRRCARRRTRAAPARRARC